jgi:hypothetical protein
VAHGDYSSIVHFWTKLSAIFEDFLEFLMVFRDLFIFILFIYSFIHSTFSRGTWLGNPGPSRSTRRTYFITYGLSVTSENFCVKLSKTVTFSWTV